MQVVIPAALMAFAIAAVPAVAYRPVGDAEASPRPHTELEESTPARDTLITTPLENVVLVFSGPVEAKLSRVRWVGPAGDTLSLEVAAVPDRPHVLIAAAPPAVNGAQRLVWLTVAADGHQVSGVIPFVADIAGLAGRDTAATAGDTGVTRVRDQAPTVEDRGSAPAAGRLVVGGVGMFCLLGFAGLLWFGAGTTILEEPRPHRVASILGLGATVLLPVDALLWLAELRLPGTDLSATFAAALDTRSGMVEVGRAGLAAAAFLLFTGTRAVKLGAAVGMLGVVVGALGGHQATIEPLLSLPANGLHLGAAAVWTGGIVLLGVWPSHNEPAGQVGGVGWTFQRVALRVSSAALLAAGTILVTGVVQDLLYLPSIGALFSSAYGNLLIAKGAGFGALVGFGAYNRFRLIPALEQLGGGDAALRRSVRLELLVVIVVVLVAVALSQVSPPME